MSTRQWHALLSRAGCTPNKTLPAQSAARPNCAPYVTAHPPVYDMPTCVILQTRRLALRMPDNQLQLLRTPAADPPSPYQHQSPRTQELQQAGPAAGPHNQVAAVNYNNDQFCTVTVTVVSGGEPPSCEHRQVLVRAPVPASIYSSSPRHYSGYDANAVGPVHHRSECKHPVWQEAHPTA